MKLNKSTNTNDRGSYPVLAELYFATKLNFSDVQWKKILFNNP